MRSSSETIIVESFSHQCEGERILHPLLKRLQNDKKVKTLYLMNVPLGENGAQLVADMLLKNTTLETLYLNGSAINDVGVTCLAKALETNRRTALKKLSLSDNIISNEGMSTLGRCLSRNNTLQELKLCENNITKMGREWGKVTIGKLYLYGNSILNVPRKYLGQRRVGYCKTFQLKKFLNEKSQQIAEVERRCLVTTSELPTQNDLWRLQTIGHTDDFIGWLDCLASDHANFKLVLHAIKYDSKCTLKFLRHGYGFLVRDIFSFLFVGDEKRYDFARIPKVSRLMKSLKMPEESDK